MRATDIMTADPVTATPAMPVTAAAELLAEHHIRSLPVVDDDGRVVGIVDELDVLRERASESGPSSGVTVAEVMRSGFSTAADDADVTDLLGLLVTDGTRLVPVLSGTELVGVVSRRDLLRVLVRDDAVVLGYARWRLADFDPARHWSVSVRDGVITVECLRLADDERAVVENLLRSVPGAVDVRIRTRDLGPGRSHRSPARMARR